MTTDIDEIVRMLRGFGSEEGEVAALALERLKASLDRMEQDWSDDNKAHLAQIERLKAERDESKAALTRLLKFVFDKYG